MANEDDGKCPTKVKHNLISRSFQHRETGRKWKDILLPFLVQQLQPNNLYLLLPQVKYILLFRFSYHKK